MPSQRYRIREVAELSGLTVRALRHYDAVGLLVPAARTAAGYRLYSDDDLLRLQQILIGRELGLPLEAIRRSLDDPAFDQRRALLEQRAQLERRAMQTASMIKGIDAALDALDKRTPREHEMDAKRIFDGFDQAKYAEEARERWGDTDAYEISARRTQSYTEADWTACRAEQDGIYRDAWNALQAGKPPDAPEVMDIAERHRLSIDRWFYPCSAAMHSGLADMYENDPRFARNIDKHGAGLTSFLSAAIRANAGRNAD